MSFLGIQDHFKAGLTVGLTIYDPIGEARPVNRTFLFSLPTNAVGSRLPSVEPTEREVPRSTRPRQLGAAESTGRRGRRWTRGLSVSVCPGPVGGHCGGPGMVVDQTKK